MTAKIALPFKFPIRMKTSARRPHRMIALRGMFELPTPTSKSSKPRMARS